MKFLSVLLLILPAIAYPQKDSVSVFFPSSEYNLSSNAKSTLDSLLNINNIEKIELFGYCDTTGSMNLNKNLSASRVNSVKRYLSKYSYTKIIINSYSKGESASFYSLYSDQLAFNRRVDIFIFHSSEKKHTGDFDLTNLKKGEKIKIPNLNFKAGTHQLLKRSYVVLDKLVSILKSHSSLKIELQGHICCTYDGDGFDPETGKNDLSMNRAKEVYNYLLQEGIDSTRLGYHGLGSSHKLVEETSEFNQEINRRVEILIVDN